MVQIGVVNDHIVRGRALLFLEDDVTARLQLCNHDFVLETEGLILGHLVTFFGCVPTGCNCSSSSSLLLCEVLPLPRCRLFRLQGEELQLALEREVGDLGVTCRAHG